MGFRGNGAAVVIGTVIALYGAFGVAQALQNAMNVIWSIPRHRRPNPVTARLRSLVLIGIAGLAVLATTAIPALGGSAGAGDVFGGWLAPLVTTLAVVVTPLCSSPCSRFRWPPRRACATSRRAPSRPP